jgi:ABC-type multidrug transport system fused ATPase/permease subunit
VVLQNGQIVEQGTHTELVAQGKIYHGLFEKQFQSMNLK